MSLNLLIMKSGICLNYVKELAVKGCFQSGKWGEKVNELSIEYIANTQIVYCTFETASLLDSSPRNSHPYP